MKPALAILSACAALAACGGSSSEGAKGQSQPPSTAPRTPAGKPEASAAAGAAAHDWTRFGFDSARSSFSTAKAGIARADLKRLKRQDVRVPGTVDSSPIYLHAVTVKGRKRDVFVVSTTYGRTLAIDAGTRRILWTFSPASAQSLGGSAQISTTSPVADPDRRSLYAASPDGRIHKLSLSSGREASSGSWPAVVTRDATHEKLAAALNLSKQYVIAVTGGYIGDAPPYQGHVLLIDRSTGRVRRVFNTLCSNRTGIITPSSCNSSDSAIWARAGAVVVPGSRHILVATGNAPWNGSTDWGDSVLELSSTLKLLGNWTPTNQAELNASDTDLGSTAPALLRAGGKWYGLQSGKEGNMKLLAVGNLNGQGRPCACTAGELQTIDAPGGAGVFTAPATWRHKGSSWAFVANGSATAAYRLVGTGAPRLKQVWSTNTAGTSPVIAGGLLYVFDPDGGGVNVYSPATGSLLATLPAGQGHWNSPIVVDGRIAIPAGNSNDHETSGTIAFYHLPRR